MARFLHQRWLVALFLFALGLALYLPALGDGLASRQQELRVILTARDMAQGGDWIVPHFMGEERLRKPPLMYWLSATCMKAANTTTSAGVARIPSALAGSLLLVVTWMAGSALVGRRPAVFGTIMLATSVGALRHARLAETDILQVLLWSASTVCAFRAIHAKRSARWWMLAGLVSGLGALVKGPIQVAIPVLSIAAYALFSRGRVPGKSLLIGGLLMMLLAGGFYGAWYAAAAQKTQAAGAQAASEASLLLNESRHPGPVYYYVYTLPGRLGLWALPWLLGLTLLWRGRHHAGLRMVAAWMSATFMLLSAIPGKQPHYALLLLPPACLIGGLALARASTQRKEISGRLLRMVVVFLCGSVAVCAAVALAATVWSTRVPVLVAVRPWLATMMLVCGAAVVCPRRLQASLLALTAAFGLGTWAYASRIERLVDGDDAVRSLLLRNQGALRAAPELFAWGDHAAMACFYAGRPVTTAATSWPNARPGSVALISARKNRAMKDLPAELPRDRQQQADVKAALVVKAEAR